MNHAFVAVVKNLSVVMLEKTSFKNKNKSAPFFTNMINQVG
jgi:hypothetical protein